MATVTALTAAKTLALVKAAQDAADEALSRTSGLLPVSGTATIPATPVGGLVGYRVLSPGVTLTAPDFSTIALAPGVYILENAPGGWVVYEIADGSGGFTPPSSPILYEDDFENPRASIYGTSTPTGGGTWSRGMGTGVGAGDGSGMALKVESGHAVTASGNGSAAFVATDWLDMRVEMDYDVSVVGSIARTFARGDYLYTTADRSVMPFQAIVRQTGVVQYEPYWNGSAWTGFQLATGQPTVGRLRMDLIGGMASVFVNDVLMGAPVTLDPKQQVGKHAGFILWQQSALAKSFRAERLT